MGGPWRQRSIDKNSAPLVALKPQAIVREPSASDGVSAAVIGFVVALVTSLGVSIAFMTFIR
jgi:hypothetical protein